MIRDLILDNSNIFQKTDDKSINSISQKFLQNYDTDNSKIDQEDLVLDLYKDKFIESKHDFDIWAKKYDKILITNMDKLQRINLTNLKQIKLKTKPIEDWESPEYKKILIENLLEKVFSKDMLEHPEPK